MKKRELFFSNELIGTYVVGVLSLNGTAEILLFANGLALVFEKDALDHDDGKVFPYWSTWK